MSIQYFSESDSAQAQASALREDGAIVVTDLASAQLVAEVADELQPHFDTIGQQFEDDFNGHATHRLASTLAFSMRAADLIAKLPSSTSLIILPFRTFGDAEAVALCKALAGNTTLTELKASGHALGTEGLSAVGALLGSGRCPLRHLAIGNSTLHAEGLHTLQVALVGAGGGGGCLARGGGRRR